MNGGEKVEVAGERNGNIFGFFCMQWWGFIKTFLPSCHCGLTASFTGETGWACMLEGCGIWNFILREREKSFLTLLTAFESTRQQNEEGGVLACNCFLISLTGVREMNHQIYAFWLQWNLVLSSKIKWEIALKLFSPWWIVKLKKKKSSCHLL